MPQVVVRLHVQPGPRLHKTQAMFSDRVAFFVNQSGKGDPGDAQLGGGGRCQPECRRNQ